MVKTWFYLYRAHRRPVRLYRTVKLPEKAGVVRITHRSYMYPNWPNEYLFRLSIGRYPEHYPFYEAHVKLYDPHTGGASKPVTAEYEFPLLSAWGGRTVMLEAEFQTVLWEKSFYNWVDVEILPGREEVKGAPVVLLPVSGVDDAPGSVEFGRTVSIPSCGRLHLALQALMKLGWRATDLYITWGFKGVMLATHRYTEDISLKPWAYATPIVKTVDSPPTGRGMLTVRITPVPPDAWHGSGRVYGWAIAEGAEARMKMLPAALLVAGGAIILGGARGKR